MEPQSAYTYYLCNNYRKDNVFFAVFVITDVSAAPTAIAALKHRKLENNALKIRIYALKDKVLYLESERDYLRIQLAEGKQINND